MNRWFSLLSFAGAVGIAVLSPTSPDACMAAPGDIYNLGTLGPAGAYGWGINSSGQVAGSAAPFPFYSSHAYRYSGTPGAGGVITDLGSLGGTYSEGYGINDSGQVAGNSFRSSLLPEHAFRYVGTPGAGGVMQDLGTLGGEQSFGYGINNSGQVAGRSATTGFTDYHAFRYTGTPGAGGVMHDLGTLGGTHSDAVGINNVGQVTGSSNYTPGDQVASHAFLYTGTPGAGGVMTDLGTLGGTSSQGSAINDAAQIAGDSQTSGDGASHAFLYSGVPGSGGAMIDLGTLRGANSAACGINAGGFVVGWAQRSDDAGGGEFATLWLNDSAHTAIDLDHWLDATNPTLGAYWTLAGTRALGINNSGLIVGTGSYDDGAGGLSDGVRPFILDASSLIPEPGSLSLLTIAGVALLRRRRRGVN